jgi:hypothetical protein
MNRAVFIFASTVFNGSIEHGHEDGPVAAFLILDEIL